MENAKTPKYCPITSTGTFSFFCFTVFIRDANSAAYVAAYAVRLARDAWGRMVTRDGRSLLFLTSTLLLLRQIQLRLQSNSEKFSNIILRLRNFQSLGNQ